MEELAKYHFTIDHRPGHKMQHADYMSRLDLNDIRELDLPQNRMDADFVLNILYTQQGIYMSQRADHAKVMPNLLQIPCGKVDQGEISYEAVVRETIEE